MQSLFIFCALISLEIGLCRNTTITKYDYQTLYEIEDELPYTLPTDPHYGYIRSILGVQNIVNYLLDRSDYSGLVRQLRADVWIDNITYNYYNFMQDILKAKGYQVIDNKLVNRFVVHKSRYPTLFRTYLNSTNEKKRSHQEVKGIIYRTALHIPQCFAKGVRIYDIGCGDGEFGSSIVKIFAKILPRGESNVTYAGVDI